MSVSSSAVNDSLRRVLFFSSQTNMSRCPVSHNCSPWSFNIAPAMRTASALASERVGQSKPKLSGDVFAVDDVEEKTSH